MKIMKMYLFLICITFSFSCDKQESSSDSSENIVQIPVFDSLQGVWNWTSTYDPKKGMIKNEFKSTVYFLSVNSDSTINYETYKNDTLEKSGKLKVFEPGWGKRRKIEPDILLHYNVTDENYLMFLTKDSLEITEKCNNCPFYYYVKE